MVITTSEACTASVVKDLRPLSEMSMHLGHAPATARGSTWSLGNAPAERTSTRRPLRWGPGSAAIWERPALCTQTKRTLGLSVHGLRPFEEELLLLSSDAGPGREE